MNATFDREERKRQKEILKGLYPDYNPVHHDVFVMRYNKECNDKALSSYMVNRGLSTNAERS